MEKRSEIQRLNKERKVELNQVIGELKQKIIHGPEGCLNICNSQNRKQYYHRPDCNSASLKYIKKSEIDYIKQLAQKDYHQKALKSAEKELRAIEWYMSMSPKYSYEEIFSHLKAERQELVIPLVETEKQFVERWSALEYNGRYFNEDVPELYTAKGERVRSKSEIIIADLLSKEGIPYRYECPLELKVNEANGRKALTRTVYPDFTVLNVRTRKELYWEHFGIMDDPEYAEKALKKILLYEQNGIMIGHELIVTFESRLTPVNQQNVLAKIDIFLK